MTDVTYEQVRYEVRGPVALVTLDRPEQLNAWTQRMAAEVRHAMARAEDDPAVVGIVLTGAGRGFCAGADMNALKDLSAGGGPAEMPSELAAEPGDPDASESFRGNYTYLLSIAKPIVAAINGPCAGMAVPIALCCDLRFMAEGAVLTTSFAQRGLIAEWGVSWLLPRLVGTAHALDLLLSARKIDGTEAARIGLVNRCLPADEVLPAAIEYVEQLSARCSPTSLRIMKRQVYEHLLASLEQAEQESFALMVESFGRADFSEGVASYLEKRPPRFPRIGGED